MNKITYEWSTSCFDDIDFYHHKETIYLPRGLKLPEITAMIEGRVAYALSLVPGHRTSVYRITEKLRCTLTEEITNEQ